MTLTIRRQHRVLPGFGLTMGYTLVYLSLLVLIPLSMLFVKTRQLPPGTFWSTILDQRVLAAYKLTFGASLSAALVNVVFGMLVTWVLVRYRFVGRRLVDGVVDLPFALPTAVAGISITTLLGANGWIGHMLTLDGPIGRALARPMWDHVPLGMRTWLMAHPHAGIAQLLGPHYIKADANPLGITIALIFIGLPFVVRTVQPVLEDVDVEIEEAAASLGASRSQTIWRVLLPTVAPALFTGFTLAFARALGEYGSVVFISSNIPYKTEIVPQLIINKLEENDYAGATAVAVAMLMASFLLLLLINVLQWWGRRRMGAV